MEKTDRELLIKEISSRLSYGIKVQVFGWDEEKGEVAIPLKVYSINTDGYIFLEYNHYNVETVYVEDCHLYLRPMSSMTEEEKHKLYQVFQECPTIIRTFPSYAEFFVYADIINSIDMVNVIDWLNANHFDYRGLIEKGLAIAVTEKNNPYKE